MENRKGKRQMAEKRQSLSGTRIKAVPKKPKEIGIDTDKKLQSDIIDAADASSLDISALEGFTNVSQTRESIYSLIDTMSQDDTISAVLETYAEDAVETNDRGEVVWVESSDDNISKYVKYLMDSINVDKNIYNWTHSLITYGDLYLKLYRESDVNDDRVFKKSKNDDRRLNESTENALRDAEKADLKEEVTLDLHHDGDHYIHYVEMVPNPGEMFELTKFGKTAGYIKAPTPVQKTYSDSTNLTSYIKYRMRRSDVTVYDATDFVHACLEDKISRSPETVDIYFNDGSYDSENKTDASTYTVKKGQSLLYNSFRVWRELSLLENSVLLSRLTKSSIVRILNVDVGDMPKSQVKNFVSRLKAQIEQKSAINVGSSMQEYTNPGPIENMIYVPTHGTQGSITASTIGGDVDPKQLTDLSYFQDKLFGSLRVPKAYFGITDDGAGFNGGTSLSIISSRYGKAVKRIQNTMCQMLTDVINLYLWDKGLNNYINKFIIRMQAPLTQEEVDRRANNDNRMRYVGDVMQQLGDIQDPTIKLKILKAMLSSVVNNTEVIGYIQEQIDIMEKEAEETESEAAEPKERRKSRQSEDREPDMPMPSMMDIGKEMPEPEPQESERPSAEPEQDDGGSYLPNPSELGFDATEND